MSSKTRSRAIRLPDGRRMEINVTRDEAEPTAVEPEPEPEPEPAPAEEVAADE